MYEYTVFSSKTLEEITARKAGLGGRITLKLIFKKQEGVDVIDRFSIGKSDDLFGTPHTNFGFRTTG
jgi:hypothetical protein